VGKSLKRRDRIVDKKQPILVFAKVGLVLDKPVAADNASYRTSFECRGSIFCGVFEITVETVVFVIGL
jgi:hypothetical protein